MEDPAGTPLRNTLDLPAKLRELEEREATYGGSGDGAYWDTGEDDGEEDSSAGDGISDEDGESSYDDGVAYNTEEGNDATRKRLKDAQMIGQAALRQQMATATPARIGDRNATPALSTDMQSIADRLFSRGGGGGTLGGISGGGSRPGTSRFSNIAGNGGASPARENMYAIMRAVGSDSDSMDDGAGVGSNYVEHGGRGAAANDSFDSDFSD